MATTTHRTPGETFAGYTQLETMTCANCAVMFAIPTHMAKVKRANGSSFLCPNGHSLSWHETDADRLKEQLEREQRRRRIVEDRAARTAAQRDQAEASARAQKSRGTRFKNERDKIRTRVAHGVCPCCNRSFQNLTRHMAGQHPEYATLEVDA